jgi:hypothetical protein
VDLASGRRVVLLRISPSHRHRPLAQATHDQLKKNQKKDNNMKNRMSLTALAGLVAVAAIAPTAQAGIDLPDPGTVGDYRVIFVTSAKPAAGSPAMADLNAWASDLAVDSGLDAAAGSPGWNIVGATTLVDVFTNTGLAATGGVPVYLVDGTAFATDNADLWGLGGTTLRVNESGEAPHFGSAIQTGLNVGPVTYAGKELDSGGNVGHGGDDPGYNPWYGNGDDWMGALGNTSLFAISGVISGGPPPAASTAAITSITWGSPNATITMTGDDLVLTYTCESSIDLINWAPEPTTPSSPIDTSTGTSGEASFTVAAGVVKKFYRIAE